MKSLLLFAVGIALVASCFSLRCQDCNRDLCKNHCPDGKTTYACNCCPACYKGPGERCGGPWNIAGGCRADLSCFTFFGEKNVDPVTKSRAFGICAFMPNTK